LRFLYPTINLSKALGQFFIISLSTYPNVSKFCSGISPNSNSRITFSKIRKCDFLLQILFYSIVGIALTIATVVFLISNISGIVSYDSEMEECISRINELMPTFDVNT
jgi:hypothetical protein